MKNVDRKWGMKRESDTVSAIAGLGCNRLCSIRSSTPIPSDAQKSKFSFSESLPESKYLPDQSAKLPDTNYVVVQSEGGSVFLGPILGSMRIAAKTKELAEKNKNQYLSVNIRPVAHRALSSMLGEGGEGEASYRVSSFAFVQHGLDQKFRFSLVFFVRSTGTKDPWVGRYFYHLNTVVSASEFGVASSEQIQTYESELESGSRLLADLVMRDVRGELAASGEKAELGSLYIIGDRMGGLGIYSMPEELYFKDVDIVEDSGDRVVVRMKGAMDITTIFGALAFGVHTFEKSQLHTFRRKNDK